MGLDLLFLLDVTVSMKPYRDAVVGEIGKIVTYLEAMFKYSKNNIRVGVVGYRDLHLTPRFELKPFTPITTGGEGSIKEWLGKLEFKTSTANDHPEDVHGGLEKAASDELGWSNQARTIIHIADAPGHGRRLAPPDAWWGPKGDNHPDFDADGSILTGLLRKLRVELQVQTYKFIHVVDPKRKVPDTAAMLQEFHKACGDPAWISEAEWQGDEEMALEVVAAASESIQQSVSTRGGLRLAPPERNFVLDPAEPDWDSVKDMAAVTSAHQIELLDSINTLLRLIRSDKHISIKSDEQDRARVRIAPRPFAKGKNRLAYYARFYPSGLAAGEVHEVVVKEFLAADGSSNSALSYKAQMETQTVASFLAGEFNRHVEEAGLNMPRIEYAPCKLLAVVQRERPVKLVKFYLMEPLLLGSMHKWNNNYGFQDLADPQPHMQAFSHWTHVVTDEMLMVVDLQGFRTLNQKDNIDIVLIDPAIHCVKSGFYGATNMASLGGFEAFLHSHNNPMFANLGGHDGNCEALVMDCKDFRQGC
ncbi:hypothetical protein GPECTOR_20g581 [Gonium pectorale]|uniref:Alpha-type protein kinase domain-containing protein n=1 Tax=Gonium pectorale TaxID=33097 RepID=A0A150GIX2_GONPE|nr:hypothetical protein GPECTOR_20g581 [Gonium pectorale]|eukprot:KXZ49724.1 hypothetical protein GPECTOR_20g581 [Gonium pectorale]